MLWSSNLCRLKMQKSAKKKNIFGETKNWTTTATKIIVDLASAPIPPVQERQRHQVTLCPTGTPRTGAHRRPTFARFSPGAGCLTSGWWVRGGALLGGKKRDYSTCYGGTCLANPVRPPPVQVATHHRLSFISHFPLQSSTELQYFYVTRGDGWWQTGGGLLSVFMVDVA